jgi:sulfite dehydrogenase (cytochrome) subunit B
MSRIARTLARCGVFVLALGCAGAQAAEGAAAAEITGLKDAPGHDLTVGRCIICHSLEYIPSNAPAMNRAAWQKTIQKMRERFGAPITDDEAKQILDYLDANYSGKAS